MPARSINRPSVDSFQLEFAADGGQSIPIGTASGLCALIVGLRALGLDERNKVVIPPMTFAATFETVALEGICVKGRATWPRRTHAWIPPP